MPGTTDLNRSARLALIALRQGGDYTGKLGRRPLDWPEIWVGLVGIALIVIGAYVALWTVGILVGVEP